MKKILFASLLSFGISALAADYQPGTYQLDPAHSKVGFEIAHLVISTVEGQFNDFSGNVELNEKFDKSKVDASVEIKSISTGNAKRDDHLKSPDFFDAAKFPAMTFKTTSISGSKDAFKLNGNLTIKGKTKPVTFDGKYLGTVVDGYGNQKVAFKASTKISRKDFDLTWAKMVEAGPVVGDEVTIHLTAQAGRPLAKK